MVAPTVVKASRWTGADTVLQEHQAAVANLGKRLMRAFVIFNGVVRSGAIVWHGTAQCGPRCWLLCRPMIATWPYFSPGKPSSPMTPQVISKYRSSTEQSVPVCGPRPGGGEEGRKSMRGGRNNSAAAVAHPPLQYTRWQNACIQ